jgi:hypothetical protein
MRSGMTKIVRVDLTLLRYGVWVGVGAWVVCRTLPGIMPQQAPAPKTLAEWEIASKGSQVAASQPTALFGTYNVHLGLWWPQQVGDVALADKPAHFVCAFAG